MLSKLKLLDMSLVLAWQLWSMLLGDLGASLIKVEQPRVADETRGWGPRFDERAHSAYLLSIHRDKPTMVGDIAEPRDTVLLHSLIADAHVAIDNLRADTRLRRGLDPDLLLADHPQLVWCTVFGFGLAAIVPDTTSSSRRNQDG